MGFKMVKVDENNFIRYSMGDHLPEYFLKRIIGCDGQPVQPYFDWFNSGGTAVPVMKHDVFGTR
jgi:hypothetical protein